MRTLGLRRLIVTMVTTLHLCAGLLATAGFCCDHAPVSGPVMECCLRGGPGHICPFMSKRVRGFASPTSMHPSCALGHDAGVAAPSGTLPPPAAVVLEPPVSSVSKIGVTVSPLSRSVYPPTPPPKA